ncbi:MAG: AAA family ATPase [Candidatus Hydrogenedentota bacterium]
MQLHVSSELAAILEHAAALSARRSDFFVGVEHVFSALLEARDKLPPAVVDGYLSRLYVVGREVNRAACPGRAPVAAHETVYSPRCIAIVGAASDLARTLGGNSAMGGHLLLALLEDPLSAPSRVMDGMKLGREECIAALRAALRGATPRPTYAVQGHGAQAAAAQPANRTTPLPEAAPAKQEDPVAALTRDLTALAEAGKLEPAIGRRQEIISVLQILARKTKHNVMIVGEAGVGKTQLVEGIALRMTKGDTKTALPRMRVLELSMAALMAGTQYRGALEEKVMGLVAALKDAPDTLLFVDEVHLIMGAGATQGDGIDVANLLKPALARGEIRCIGATTLQEYRQFVEKDPAIERRFQMVRVEELSEEVTLEILYKMRDSFCEHHGVRIGARALQTAVELAVRYIPNRQLPDKAIDVIDQACARHRLRAIAAKGHSSVRGRADTAGDADKVTPHDVRQVVSQIASIPLEELTKEERLRLRSLDHRIERQLIGQDVAIERVVAAVKKSRAGLADPNRPDAVLLFLGPTGVGKTRMAKVLAHALFGSEKYLATFDMSEYVESHSVSRLLGAPPGYVGSEEEGRLGMAVRSNPFSVLLFDEIEKAHERVFDIFLPIFEEGRLKDARGRNLSFRNCIIILTSNVGAEQLAHGGDVGDEALMAELRRHFRPEFINRIDEIVPFFPLLSEDIRSILRLEVNALRERLRDKGVGIRMYQRAYEHLASLARTDRFGARDLRRVVEREVAGRLSELLLNDAFAPGDMIDVKMEPEGLVVAKGPPQGAVKDAGGA